MLTSDELATMIREAKIEVINREIINRRYEISGTAIKKEMPFTEWSGIVMNKIAEIEQLRDELGTIDYEKAPAGANEELFKKEYVGSFNVKPIPINCPYCNRILSSHRERAVMHIEKCVHREG